MSLAPCERLARLPLAAGEGGLPRVATAQSTASYSTGAYRGPAKKTAASTGAEIKPPHGRRVMLPISAGGVSGASNFSRASPRQKHHVSPPPASEAIRHCAWAYHHVCPQEKLQIDLTFDSPLFPVDNTPRYSRADFWSSHTGTQTRFIWTRHCALKNSSPE